MIASMRDNDELQMNAYCDGELDPASAIEFERRLAGDETLKAQYNRLLSLRRTVRSLPQYDYLQVCRPASSLRWMRIVRARWDVRPWRYVRSRWDVRGSEAGRFRRWPRQRCLAR